MNSLTKVNYEQTHVLSEFYDRDLFQEHAATPAVLARWKQTMKLHGWCLKATPSTDQGSGVGVLYRDPIRVEDWQTKGSQYLKLREAGRLAIYQCGIGDQ